MLFGGVFVGEKKPKMNVYLKPFVDSMKKLAESGVSWVHPRSKARHISRVACPVMSVDAPAKALVCNCKQFNGRYGCNVCEQKSKRIEDEADEDPVGNNNEGKKKRGDRGALYSKRIWDQLVSVLEHALNNKQSWLKH